MKNQYFGDLSDYKKYGILRSLVTPEETTLLVCWMLTEDDGSTDGKHTSYLSDPFKWRAYDPKVFDLLRDSVLERNLRKVSIIEKSGLIRNAEFFSDFIEDDLTLRESFFDALYKRAERKTVVFIDPDNGLEVKSVPYGRKGSRRYLYWNEVEQLYSTGSSLLIYQHFGRQDRDLFIKILAKKAKQTTKARLVISLRVSHTVFFLVVQEEHHNILLESMQFLKKTWDKQITVVKHTASGSEEIKNDTQYNLI